MRRGERIMSTNTEILFVVEESPAGGFIARGVGEDIVTEADTLAELRNNVREAIECHFDAGQPRLVSVSGITFQRPPRRAA